MSVKAIEMNTIWHIDTHTKIDVFLCQFYGNRYKMGIVGRGDELEKQNRLALKMAREVADSTGTLMCGDLSNTFVYQPDNDEAIEKTKEMFKVKQREYNIGCLCDKEVLRRRT